MTDICLFPIPECVTFPGTIFPLHVFEPRYRQMIQHCLDTNTPVAICHTEKLLSPGKPNDSIREVLSSNQATYKPYPVFSAGQCELIETTEDGRMYLEVQIQQRYRAIAEKQTLPFLVYECEPFNDRQSNDEEHAKANQLQEKILMRLSALAQTEPDLQDAFDLDSWQQLTAEDFSFQLFGALSFGADTQQQLLEMDTPNARLQLTLKLLNQYSYSS